jgi:hypothetical protein
VGQEIRALRLRVSLHFHVQLHRGAWRKCTRGGRLRERGAQRSTTDIRAKGAHPTFAIPPPLTPPPLTPRPPFPIPPFPQDAPPYNVALAVFLLMAHHTHRGRHIFGALILTVVSLIPDFVALSSLNLHQKTNIIAVALIPINAVLKLVAAVSAYWVFISVGGTWSLAESAVPVEGSGHDGASGLDRTPSVADSAGMPRSYSEAEGGYRDTPGGSVGFYSPAQIQGGGGKMMTDRIPR